MQTFPRELIVLAALSALGIITHLVPHEMGISTVGAIGILSAAYLPRSLMLAPVFITIIVVDAYNGFYSLLAMSFVYLAHLGAAMIARPFIRSVNLRRTILASMASAVAFYLISNLTPMAMSFYPATLEGWLTCYVNGLPFLWRGIVSNFLFSGIVFGLVWLSAQNINKLARANRFSTTQRH